MADPFEHDEELDQDIEESSNLAAVRDYAKRQERRARRLERELEEMRDRLERYEAERATEEARRRARERGFTDEQFEALRQVAPKLTPEAVDTLASLFVGRTEENEQEANVEPKSKATVPETPVAGFTPAPGTPGVPSSASWEEIKAAIRRGDRAFLERLAAEHLAGRPIDLGKYGHLVDDDSVSIG